MKILVSGNYVEAMDDESRAIWEAKSAAGECEITAKRSVSWEWGGAQHRETAMVGVDRDGVARFRERMREAYRALLGERE